MRGEPVRPIVIAAGGTGGHFFPAEALTAELVRRGRRVALMTDARSGALRSEVFAGREVFVLRGSGIAGRGVLRGAAGALGLLAGTVQARGLLQKLDASVVVGFGGYPSVPPVMATRALRRRPAVVLHEQNAVLGRATRTLTPYADAVALGLPGAAAPAKHVLVGNPVRPAIRVLHGAGYAPPGADGPLRLLVVGGSLGARVFSDVVPPALAALPPALRHRLRVVQQCRAEDLARVQVAYAGAGIEAELSAFFPDMPARLRDAHFVVARAGASTVAELCVAGRPALLVPLPGAIDNHQAANAAASGADSLPQAAIEADPAGFAQDLADRLQDPARLSAMAAATAANAVPDAAARLADLVEQHIQASAQTGAAA